MKHKNIISILVLFIIILAGIAAATGIYSSQGPGKYIYESIRGKPVMIHGQGLYMHMSEDVAPQGIAQDYVTLFIGIPLLFISLFWARRGSLKGRYVLTGTLGYFLVTYLFYLSMGMFNMMFLVYAGLLCSTFFSFVLSLLTFDISSINEVFDKKTPVKATGGFLIFNAFSIAMLWLSIVIPPLLDGTIIPRQVEHYTTLIVQGFDLGLLLPIAFVSGVLIIRKNPFGLLFVPVYFVFLSLLMIALTAKIIAMNLLGQNVIPVIFIIPIFALISIICAIALIKNIKRS